MAQMVTPLSWASHTDGETKHNVNDGTVHDLLMAFVRRFPGLESRLLDGNGQIQRYFKVFIDDSNVPYAQFRDVSTTPDNTILIVPPMAGG